MLNAEEGDVRHLMLGLCTVLVVIPQTSAGLSRADGPIPQEYTAMFHRLDAILADIHADLDSRWDKSLHPVFVPMASVQPANSNSGPDMLRDGVLDFTKLFISRLKTMGCRGVQLDIQFPILDPDYFEFAKARGLLPADSPEQDAYLDFYRQVVAFIRSEGLVVSIESQIVFTQSVWSSLPVAEYYAQFDAQGQEGLALYMQRKADMLRVIAAELQPDLLTICDEPETEMWLTGIDLLTNRQTYLDHTHALVDIVNSVRPAHMKTGAGYLPGSDGWQFWAEHLNDLDIEFINIHVYPIDIFPQESGDNVYSRILQAIDMAHAAGKQIGIGEAWLYKQKPDDPFDPELVYGRDYFDFFAPLDQRFLAALLKIAHHKKLLFLSPFWSQFFFSYLSYQEAQPLSTADRKLLNNARTGVNTYWYTLSDTGAKYANMITHGPQAFSLFFVPHVAGESWETRIAVDNRNDKPTDLIVTQWPPENDQTFEYELPALDAIAVEDSQLIPDGLARLTADAGNLAPRLTYRFGSSESVCALPLPADHQSPAWLLPNPAKPGLDWFGLAVSNFSNEPVELDMTALREGKVMGRWTRSLPGHEKVVDLSAALWNVTSQDIDMVAITADAPIPPPLSIAGNAAQDRHLFFFGRPISAPDRAQRLVLPHIANQPWRTELVAYNPAPQGQEFGLSTTTPGGQLGEVAVFSVPPFSVRTLEAGRDFPRGGAAIIDCAYAGLGVKAEKGQADLARLLFQVSYQFSDRSSVTTFFLDPQTSCDWWLPTFGHDSLSWFGLAVANLGETTTQLNLKAFRDGYAIAKSTRTLAVGEKLVETSTGLFGLAMNSFDGVQVTTETMISAPLGIMGNASQDRHVLFPGQKVGASTQELVMRSIAPPETSPGIESTIGDHLAVIGSAHLGRLLVFFPGTGARPDQYSFFLQRAAELGYHVIGLAYHNGHSINFDICAGTDPASNCHEKARLEILLGEESGYDPPHVDADNAAFHRLLKLLEYLDQRYPWEGWDRFFEGHEPLWDQMVVAGHSQGGGHAAMTAKLHVVAGALLFGATEPATWTWEPLSTPSDRLWGFAHADELNFNAIVRSWDNLGLVGRPVNVDQISVPFDGSQRLFTSTSSCRGDPNSRGQAHNCPIVDEFIPLNDAGEPVFAYVWDAMLKPFYLGSTRN